MDTELSFALQINRVVSLNKKQLKTLVSTLVLTKLDYCNSLYYGLNTQLIKKLQVVQNSALRLIYGINRYDRSHATPIFTELHWLKIRERIVFKLLLIVYKCVTGEAPRDSYNGMYGQHSFSVAAPKLWNALSLRIREEETVTMFKKSLKSFLMTNSDNYFQAVNMK